MRLRRAVSYGFLLSMTLLPNASGRSSAEPALPVVPGQSRTILSDGRWLLVGGQGQQGPLATAHIFDPQTSSLTSITQALLQGRSWHTATVLADGRVLIAGGVGLGGQVSTVLEIFDPAEQTFHLAPAPCLVPRAEQTATLLTDGRVLFAGGLSAQGQVLGDAQLLNPVTSAVEGVQPLSTPRRGGTATLLADGRVLLWGGFGATGVVLTAGDVFDPAQANFAQVTARPTTPDPSDSPQLETSVPLVGTMGVPTDSVLALRFSKPLRVDPTIARTVTLSGPAGLEGAMVVAAEGGMLVFVTPRSSLAQGTTYTLTVNGAVDATGLLVPFTSVPFQTASPPTVIGAGVRVVPAPAPKTTHFHPASALRPGTPGEIDDEWRGELCDGKPCSKWQRLPPLRAPRGITALAGQMLRLNGEPLAQAALTIGTRSARTDSTGRFLLTGIASGDQVLIMDGSTANRPGRSYGLFEYYVDIEDGQTTVLPFTIWMPLLVTKNATVIPVPTPAPMVARTPKVPGLEVRIPGNVVLQTSGGPLTSMPLTRIPVDRPPFPLPPGATFSFTPQAHGALVQRPDGTPKSDRRSHHPSQRRRPAARHARGAAELRAGQEVVRLRPRVGERGRFADRARHGRGVPPRHLLLHAGQSQQLQFRGGYPRRSAGRRARRRCHRYLRHGEDRSGPARCHPHRDQAGVSAKRCRPSQRRVRHGSEFLLPNDAGGRPDDLRVRRAGAGQWVQSVLPAHLARHRQGIGGARTYRHRAESRLAYRLLRLRAPMERRTPGLGYHLQGRDGLSVRRARPPGQSAHRCPGPGGQSAHGDPLGHARGVHRPDHVAQWPLGRFHQRSDQRRGAADPRQRGAYGLVWLRRAVSPADRDGRGGRGHDVHLSPARQPVRADPDDQGRAADRVSDQCVGLDESAGDPADLGRRRRLPVRLYGGRHWPHHADRCDRSARVCPPCDLQCLRLSAHRHASPWDTRGPTNHLCAKCAQPALQQSGEPSDGRPQSQYRSDL